MPRSTLVAVVASLVALIGGVVTAGPAQAAPYPVTTSVERSIAAGFSAPATTAPAGSNRFTCRDRFGRDPVILLHGTSLNQNANWGYLAPTLANAGYCVFSITYGQTSWSGNIGGLGNKDRSARQVADFLGEVLRRTGARQVDFVGHSQGGAIAQLVSQLPGRAGPHAPQHPVHLHAVSDHADPRMPTIGRRDDGQTSWIRVLVTLGPGGIGLIFVPRRVLATLVGAALCSTPP